jgi:hypothetical protein
MSARPITSSVSVSWRAAISAARSDSALGVRSLAGRFLVGGDDQLVDAGAAVLVLVVALALEQRELVGAHHAALHERRGVGVGDVVGELPAQRLGPELAGAGDHAAGDDPGALGIELVALAQPGDQPALAVGMGEGELAVAGLGLTGIHQRAEHAVRRVVRDLLILEETDRDRVRPRPWRRLGSGANLHAKARILVSRPCPTP